MARPYAYPHLTHRRVSGEKITTARVSFGGLPAPETRNGNLHFSLPLETAQEFAQALLDAADLAISSRPTVS